MLGTSSERCNVFVLKVCGSVLSTAHGVQMVVHHVECILGADSPGSVGQTRCTSYVQPTYLRKDREVLYTIDVRNVKGTVSFHFIFIHLKHGFIQK